MRFRFRRAMEEQGPRKRNSKRGPRGGNPNRPGKARWRTYFQRVPPKEDFRSLIFEYFQGGVSQELRTPRGLQVRIAAEAGAGGRRQSKGHDTVAQQQLPPAAEGPTPRGTVMQAFRQSLAKPESEGSGSGSQQTRPPPLLQACRKSLAKPLSVHRGSASQRTIPSSSDSEPPPKRGCQWPPPRMTSPGPLLKRDERRNKRDERRNE